jgi:hypothetical protein
VAAVCPGGREVSLDHAVGARRDPLGLGSIDTLRPVTRGGKRVVLTPPAPPGHTAATRPGSRVVLLRVVLL